MFPVSLQVLFFTSYVSLSRFFSHLSCFFLHLSCFCKNFPSAFLWLFFLLVKILHWGFHSHILHISINKKDYIYQFLLPIALFLWTFKRDQNIAALKVKKYFVEIYWTSNGRTSPIDKRRSFSGEKMKCWKCKTPRLCWDLSTLRSTEKSGDFLID